MRLLASLILVVALAGLPSCKFLQNKVFGKKARALAELKAKQDSIRVADSIRSVQERLLALENARLDSIRLSEEQRKANEYKFNIIVGSFLTPVYAKALAEEYGKHGYKTQIIPMNGTKFELVAAEGHNNLRDAVKRLTAFQDTVQIDSWIYVR
jgi:hypothetical protein